MSEPLFGSPDKADSARDTPTGTGSLPPLKRDDAVALGLRDGRCPMGLVDEVTDGWIRLSLFSVLTGYFGFATELVPVAEVASIRMANAMTPEQIRHEGYTLSEEEKERPFYDMEPLGRFQTRWHKAHRSKSKTPEVQADRDVELDRLLSPTKAPSADSNPSRPNPAETVHSQSWTSADLDDVLSAPLPPWIIKWHIRAGQFGFLIAAPTVGKSTLAAAWIMCVLHDLPWCGNDVKGGSVVALVGEGRRGFCNRLDAFRRHYELSHTPPDRYLEVVDFKEPLSTPKGQAELRSMIRSIVKKQGHAPRFIVVDTLSSHWAGSEDSAEFGAPAMRALGDVAHDQGAAVLVVHHTTKAKGRKSMPELADCRGTGSFIGNSDFVFGMCSTRADDGAVLKGLKLKDDDAPPKICLRMESVECEPDTDGESVTAALFLNEALPAGGEATGPAQDSEVRDRDVLAIVSAVHELGSVTKRDAALAQAHIGVVRGRALFDIAMSKAWLENAGTDRRPKYVVTDEGRRRALTLIDDEDTDAGEEFLS